MEMISSICRICMKDGVKLLYIFSDAGDPDSLQKKIEICTTLKMNPGDGLPDTVCGYCARDVEHAYNLQTLAISTNKILLRMFTIDYVDEVSTAVTSEDEEPIKTKRVSDATAAAAVTVRSDIFNNILRKKRKRNPKEEDPETVIAEVIVKGELTESEPEEGMEEGMLADLEAGDDDIAYAIEADEIEEIELEDDKTAIQLSQFIKRKKGFRHIKSPRLMTEDCVQCDICKKFIYGSASLDHHIKTVHERFQFECNECDDKFEYAINLKDHKNECHPDGDSEPELECGICRRKFKCTKSLEEHGKLHESKSKKLSRSSSEKTKYKRSYYEARCETCGIDGFDSAEDRRKHHTAHNGVYECKLCDKVFGFDMSFHTHFMNVHQGIKFECDQCQQLFTLASSLKRHKLTVHTNIFRFHCQFCNKPFKQKTQCETHVRSIHTKEKPFACEICDTRFSDQSTLIKHRKTHVKASGSGSGGKLKVDTSA